MKAHQTLIAAAVLVSGIAGQAVNSTASANCTELAALALTFNTLNNQCKGLWKFTPSGERRRLMIVVGASKLEPACWDQGRELFGVQAYSKQYVVDAVASKSEPKIRAALCDYSADLVNITSMMIDGSIDTIRAGR